ncbi:TauD/TfdA family dioxygenase [Glycomyces arizonensis]|uniref:TauD/TfdA family dioxygenase n=1 Tax=Glycomyces arizonensis TaxID=256035 RepID=UPI000408D769|nr:TauD/TfdA family dioxygenase [Glycomyces arizonensis]
MYRPIPADAVAAMPPSSAEAVKQLAKEIVHRHGDRQLDTPELLTDLEVLRRSTDPGIASKLVDFRQNGTPAGLMLITGLPVDSPLSPTPGNGQFSGAWTDLAVSTVAQLVLMSHLGDVISYADEKAGRLVQDVCPVPGAESLQENSGSRLLELHTEDGFHPNMPHFVGLMCLRGDHEGTAYTLGCGIGSVLERLDEETVEALRRPEFRIRFASSFTGGESTKYSDAIPILSGPRADPDLCVDFHAMEGDTLGAKKALGVLEGLFQEALIGVVLKPGDLLVIDNRRAVHGRTAFKPRYDGTDRWLRRCFVVNDIRRSRGHRRAGSRVHREI